MENFFFICDKDFNSPRECPADGEKELIAIQEKMQKAHMDKMNPNNCILVILISRIFPTGILMQGEDIILEWICFTT